MHLNNEYKKINIEFLMKWKRSWQANDTGDKIKG